MVWPDSTVTSSRAPEIIPTDTSSNSVCYSFAGVNRVLNLEPYLLIDNIGRNIEVWRFHANGVEPAQRGWYDRTSTPSLLDVDLHAAFLRGDDELLTVDHYGRMWRFSLPPSPVQMRPTCEVRLLAVRARPRCFVACHRRPAGYCPPFICIAACSGTGGLVAGNRPRGDSQRVGLCGIQSRRFSSVPLRCEPGLAARSFSWRRSPFSRALV